MHIWKNGYLKNFIGSGTEGNSDGIASSCQLYQPTGICVEFDNVVYFTDYRTASVKITSTLSHASAFLQVIEKLMKAFSIHEKKGMIMFDTFLNISKKNKCKKSNRALRLNMCMKYYLESRIVAVMLLSKRLKSVGLQWTGDIWRD